MTTITNFYKPDTSDLSDSVIARITRWFKKAKPNPNANDFSTQLGVHFEEITEMLDAMNADSSTGRQLLMSAHSAMLALSDHCKGTTMDVYVLTEDRDEFLDSLADQIVTSVGCGTLIHMDVTGAIEEVSRSNDSKFEPETGLPIFNAQGKIMKGPAYSPPSLARFV
jgi:predicted HAD superfamily Cof-like phosphohydrolase